MCNVHFIKALDGKLSAYDLKQMSNMLESASRGNPHGFGHFSNKDKFKSGKAFDERKHGDRLNQYKNHDFVVGHNRYATHGEHSAKNSHPFENDRFVYVHNGVIQNFEELKAKHFPNSNLVVDSEIIGELILKYTGLNDKDVVKAIKKTTKKLDGWYSVFLYDKKFDKLYYFRDGADFYFRLLRKKTSKGYRHIVVGSTRKDNIRATYQDKRKQVYGIFKANEYELLNTIEIEQDKIYLINGGIREVGKFTPMTTYTYTEKKACRVNNVTDDEEKNVPIEKLFDNEDGQVGTISDEDVGIPYDEDSHGFWDWNKYKKKTKEAM